MALVADALDAPPRAARVGGAFSVSLLFHGAALLGVIWFMHEAPAANDAAELESVAVEMVSTQSASDTDALVESDAAQTLTARGTTTIATAEAVQPEDATAVPVETTLVAEAEQPTAAPPVKVEAAAASLPERTLTAAPAAMPLQPSEPAAPVSVAEPVATIEAVTGELPLAAAEAETAMPTLEEPVRNEEPAPSRVAETTEPASAQPTEPVQIVKATNVPASAQPATESPSRAQMVARAEPISLRSTEQPTPRKTTALKAAKPVPKPAAKPAKQKPTETKPVAKTTRQASAGSGGKDEVNAKSSARSSDGGGKVAAGGSGADSNYKGVVRAAIGRAFHFPRLVSGNTRGTAMVEVRILASGSLGSVTLARSSGSNVIDRASLDAVRQAAPFPPIPASIGRTTVSYTLPVHSR